MAFVCEDLARYGVVLIPPSTTEYFELQADIERRLQTRPEGWPPVEEGAISRISDRDTSGSAILLNQADVAIAAIAYVWAGTGTFLPGTNPSVLLPFGLDDRSRKVQSFWNTIFPGSKRLLTCDGSWFADNSNVRPPAADELSRGWWRVGVGRRADRPKPTKLTLDGVFFVDGETRVCGSPPDRAARIPDSAEAVAVSAFHLSVRSGLAPGRGTRLRRCPWCGLPWPAGQRRGADAAVVRIEAWADAPVPKFHKL